MSLRDRIPPPERCVEAFVVANLAFLGVDIRIAHAANEFASRAEWAPVVFSVIATLLLAPGVVSPRIWTRTRVLSLAVGAASIAVGVTGMLLHLESGFFQRHTVHDLVYAAPFAAPLAYVGVGLLTILSRLEEPGSLAWATWVVFLACGGFLGNLVLSLTDHAQNGFFDAAEWIAVGAAAFGTSFLLLAALRPRDRALVRACLVVLGVEALVGAAGAVLHLRADWKAPAASISDRFVFGAPAFAPLLYTNLALLGALGLWAAGRAQLETSTQFLPRDLAR